MHSSDSDDALDALLARASTVRRAPDGLEDAVMKTIRLERARRHAPWYARWQTGATAAALAACAVTLSLTWHGTEAPALDETLLVEASMASLGDADMIQAVYNVSARNGAALAQDDLAFWTP